jgi:hypothetical protein
MIRALCFFAIVSAGTLITRVAVGQPVTFGAYSAEGNVSFIPSLTYSLSGTGTPDIEEIKDLPANPDGYTGRAQSIAKWSDPFDYDGMTVRSLRLSAGASRNIGQGFVTAYAHTTLAFTVDEPTAMKFQTMSELPVAFSGPTGFDLKNFSVGWPLMPAGLYTFDEASNVPNSPIYHWYDITLYFVVPEPGTAELLAIGGMLFTTRRRCRRSIVEMQRDRS